MFNFDEATIKGKEVMDAMLKSGADVTSGLQAIAAEAADYTRKSYEHGIAHAEALSSAKSPEMLFELQTTYMRSSYEAAVSEMTKIVALYADLGKAAYKPFEAPVSRMAPVAKARQAVAEVVETAEKSINAA